MPGLIEMHAHLDDGYGGNFGRVWLAYGITSVRIPSINPYAALEQREAFDAGRRPGPRVFLAGDPFDGARVYYPGGVVGDVRTAQLEQELDRASTLGVDFFKTYVRLPDRLQKRIVDYAHASGQAGDVARALSGGRVRHRRRRAPARHEPARLLAEAERARTAPTRTSSI